MDRSSDEFILLLTNAQPTIYACIYSLLPDRSVVLDLVQETNLTLCRKVSEFEPGTNFNAWAARIARYHVLNYRRKANREHLVFDDALFHELCERQEERVDSLQRHFEAMRECLKKLSPSHRQMLEARYAPGGTVTAIAEAEGKSVGAVSQTLYRLRQSLMDCIYQRIQEGAI